MPKGHTVRKVRASQGRIADNVSRRRLPGKCNRNRPPALRRVRMERRGKSSPVSMVTWIRCKPYPKQHRMGIVCPTHIPGWHTAKSRGAFRRRDAKTDGRPRQNPAYRQSCNFHTDPRHYRFTVAALFNYKPIPVLPRKTERPGSLYRFFCV